MVWANAVESVCYPEPTLRRIGYLLRGFPSSHLNFATRIRYAAIGGFALGFWGVTRATIDMDLLLLIDDAPRAETILAKYAYQASSCPDAAHRKQLFSRSRSHSRTD